MGRSWCALAAALVAVSVGVPATFAQWPEITVDCDQGDNLYKALDQIEGFGQGTIKVLGTCYGTYVVRARGLVNLVGESPATSAIVGGGNGSLVAADPGQLQIHNLRLSGMVRVLGASRWVGLVGCEVNGADFGVWARDGAFVALEETVVSASGNALTASQAVVQMEHGSLRDSTYGAWLYRSRLTLIDTDVTDNEVAGILADERSNVTVAEGRLAHNGEAHVAGRGDSRITLYDTEVGGPRDQTDLFLFAEGGTAVELFYDQPRAEVWGPAYLLEDSFLAAEGATLHGSVTLRGFSRMKLEGSVEDGVVDCQSAADVWCGPTASAVTTGCPGVPTVCLPAPADALTREAEAPRLFPRVPTLPELPGLPEGALQVDPEAQELLQRPLRVP